MSTFGKSTFGKLKAGTTSFGGGGGVLGGLIFGGSGLGSSIFGMAKERSALAWIGGALGGTGSRLTGFSSAPTSLLTDS